MTARHEAGYIAAEDAMTAHDEELAELAAWEKTVRAEAAIQALLDAADDPAMGGNWAPFANWLRIRAGRLKAEARNG